MKIFFLLLVSINCLAQLGQIPGGGSVGYYHLGGTSDSGPNGFTLTNNNSVAFNAGKFNNAADMGSSGTNKGLTYSSNPFSSTTPDKVYWRFWFKMNSTSDHNGVFTVLSSDVADVNGRNYQSNYTIASGSITISTVRVVSVGGTQSAGTNIVFTPTTTDWYLYEAYYDSSVPIFAVNVFNANMTIISAQSSANNTSGASTSGGTRYFSIGNNRSLSSQCRCMIDEYVFTETIPSASDRQRYRTQATGKNINQ